MISKVFRSMYVVCLMMILFSARVNAAQKFHEIISFGDNLTDVGNVAGITIPGKPPLIPGYFHFTHFSDGPIWIEYVADFLHLPARTPGRGSSTSLPPLPHGNDWAWGGSEAAAGFANDPNTTEPVPNLLTEVKDYLKANKPKENILYTIWAGADNFLEGMAFGPEGAQKAVNAIAKAMIKLNKAGARNFLVLNLPELGDTPGVISQGQIVRSVADIYTNFFNEFLKKAIKKLCKDPCFKANIYFVDVNQEFLFAVGAVKSGFPYVPSTRFFVPGPQVPPVVITNVTDPAIFFISTITHVFPTNFLFFDPVHPTTQGHQVIAGLVLQALGHK